MLRSPLASAELLMIQRAAGNAAVLGLLARRKGNPRASRRVTSTAQRQMTVQRLGEDGRARQVLRDVEAYERRLYGVSDKFPEFAREMRPQLVDARAGVDTACTTYDRAYAAFNDVIQAAGERAKSIDWAQDTAINVALSVLIAVAWEVVAAEVAATAVAQSGAAAAAATRQSLRSVAITGTIQDTAANVATSNPTGVSVSATAFPERGGRDRALRGEGASSSARDSLALYRELVSLISSVERINGVGLEFGHLHRGASNLRAKAAELAGAGSTDAVTLDRISAAVTSLNAALDRMPNPDTNMSAVRARVESFAKRLAQDGSGWNDRDVERKIWVGWMARIPRESVYAVLDLDPIENHLLALGVIGPRGSMLGVDFGGWTSEEDTRQAHDAAIRARDQLDHGRKWLIARSAIGQVGVISVYRGRENTASIRIPGSEESLQARISSRGVVPTWLEGRPGRITGVEGEEGKGPPICVVWDLAESSLEEDQPVE